VRHLLSGLGAGVLVLLAAPPAGAADGVPAGYRMTVNETLASGVTHRTLVRANPAEVVNVALIRHGAPVSLRVVDAPPAPGGMSVQRTSSLCAQVHCVAGVNGDFFDTHTGSVIGGVVSGGRPVKSPNPRHHQLSVAADGTLTAGVVAWRTTVVPTDLQPLSVVSINVPRPLGVVLYTPMYGATTAKVNGATELTGVIESPRGPLRMGQTVVVRLTRSSGGGTPIPRNGVVLSGRGSAARTLADLWRRVGSRAVASRVLLRTESTPAAMESIGGAPVLVRHGRRWVQSTGGSFVTGRHPRTAVGWTRGGDVLLVTVDGRQPGYSEGMSLPELADLMLGLGADEAMNLDGGGSTTFARGADVLNRPSDRLVRRYGRSAVVHLPGRWDQVVGNVERPVGNILAVVSLNAPGTAADPLANLSLGPQVRYPTGPPDPGSNPSLALPALVTRTGSVPALVLVALGLVAAAGSATAAQAAVVVRGARR
jgi:hypothetical protein